MEIIKNIENIFKSFNEDNYIKLFINFYNSKSPIWVSIIDRNIFKILTSNFKDFFTVNNNHLYLKEKYNTQQSITNVFNIFAQVLEKLNLIKIRGENILLQSIDGKYNLGYVDRSLLHVFGFLAEGIHINAYVEKINKEGLLEKYLWISKRSKNKIHDPSKLDNLVAGAVSLGFSAFETVIKESNEEAGINKTLSQTSVLKQKIAYKVNKYGGVRNDIVHIFELKLPESFVPKAIDGEVEEFFLLDCQSILNILINNFNSFKYNSGLVVLHFLYVNNFIKNTQLNTFLKTLFQDISI